ncbi:MAG TPA: hypothetical protein ENK53_07775 [Thiotrichales bacterium]|nr:hypothetical protein [Thiotrichales bacterium]
MKKTLHSLAVAAALASATSAQAWWGPFDFFDGDGFGAFDFDFHASAHSGFWGDYWDAPWWAYPYYAYPAAAVYPAPAPTQEQIQAQQEAMEAQRKAIAEAIAAQQKAAAEYARQMQNVQPVALDPVTAMDQHRRLLDQQRQEMERMMEQRWAQIEAQHEAARKQMDELRAQREAEMEKHRKAMDEHVALADRG